MYQIPAETAHILHTEQNSAQYSNILTKITHYLYVFHVIHSCDNDRNMAVTQDNMK